MSFVRLDSGEFPPLNKVGRIESHSKKGHKETTPDHANSINPTDQQNNPKNDVNIIADTNDFIRCRIGRLIHDYHEDLETLLKTSHVGQLTDFIIIPIRPIRSSFYGHRFDVIPDLALSYEDWHTRIAIDLGHPTMDYYDPTSVRHFDELFQHALYLSAPVIVITCPDSDLSCVSVASTVIDRLNETKSTQLVLFKVSFTRERYQTKPNSWLYESSDFDYSQEDQQRDEEFHMDSDPADNDSAAGWSGQSSCANSNGSQDSKKPIACPWKQWNAIRSHLNPDTRVGVCLVLSEDIISDDDKLARWMGEPVRMIIINTCQFVRSPGHNGSLRLNLRCKEFITRLMVANSLKTSLIIEGQPNQSLKEHLLYLDYLIQEIKNLYPDELRDWDDKIQPPLQPLSSNLDSSTYGVFEMDSKKYQKYKDAMFEALQHLTSSMREPNREFRLMVLGAGRGPLVDALIIAISSLKSKKHRFKIYALDKNPSSVRSLLYKQKNQWDKNDGNYNVEVVEADMREWRPNIVADIVATELLGSLADNELSPECIDGVWSFCNSSTISIPQEYSSYLAPICSFKMHQELARLKSVEQYAYDQIYVVKLQNCYHIDRPQQLFQFKHQDLSLPPSKRCNERYNKLIFWSKTDTVCHGFAGYFSAKLFGSVTLSTLIGKETRGMNSWFPAFIPLEQPIQMIKGTQLVVHFWRKESTSSVWYQWVVSHPQRSRLYSQNGLNTSMSKSI